MTENGEPVEALKIGSLGGQSAVVLAIDGSRSMGRKIDDAMNAARAFADKRLPDQRLGIVFFSSQPQVALEPTTDAAAIDAALPEAPTLPKGTQVYDAAAEGVAMIKRAGVAAGSVIVLSDGADYRQRGHAQRPGRGGEGRPTCGCSASASRRPSFDAATLQSLAVTGGDYVEAAQPEDLSAHLRAARRPPGREFLVSYRSRQPLESDVAVAFSVARGPRPRHGGVPRRRTSRCRRRCPEPGPTWWESSAATNSAMRDVRAAGGVRSLDAGEADARTTSRRIALFTGGGSTTTSEEEATTVKVRELLDAADGRLSKWRPWLDFVLDVELAKLSWTPGRIVLVTSLATFGSPLGSSPSDRGCSA